MTRFNTRSAQIMRDTIDEWINQAEVSLDAQDSYEYPNEARIDKLNDRLDSLRSAYDALDEVSTAP